MLEELTIQNYALIDRLRVQLGPGLNIFSGETGAGKSIMIGALGVLLGVKADTGSIRTGAEELAVSGVVRMDGNAEALAWLSSRGVEPEEDSIIIRRVVRRTGRSSVFVQSTPFTLSDLRELTAFLFDLHGQHEHQSLLEPDNHRRLLDRFAGCTEQVEQFAALHSRLVKARERHASLLASERERLRQMDLLRFAIQEIQEARLVTGEEEELDKEHQILANHERLVSVLEEIRSAMGESGLAALRKSRSAMVELLQIDPQLEPLSRQLDNAFYELEDFSESLARYAAGVVFDPRRLAQVEERLGVLRRLEKKYGSSIEEVLAFSERSQQELKDIENWEESKGELEAEIAALERELRERAASLTEGRTAAREVLQGRVEAELRQLGMPKVRFQVDIRERTNEAGRPVYTATGKDRVEFMISANLGEPFKRLAQIASGGELSRIMLAIKTVLAESDQVNTLVFDEVDAGIGGEVALAVGERLKLLSRHKQILCITHLATIAVRADNHIRVEKHTREQRTVTRAETVGGARRREEIARMLAGDRTGEASLKHAEELLRRYGGSGRKDG